MRFSNYSINITNQKRACLTLLIITLLLLFLLNFIFPIKIVAGTEEPQYVVYKVKNGDTLWSIAQNYNYSNKDIREIVFEINKINNRDNTKHLIQGESLKIPY